MSINVNFFVLVMLNCVFICTLGSSICVDEVFNLVFSGKTATDYVVRNTTVPSRAECSVLCHQEEGCVFVAYSASGECVLYSELPQTLTVVSTLDTDIYYRQGAVPQMTTTTTAYTTTTTTLTPTVLTTTHEGVSSTSTINAATPMTTTTDSTTSPAVAAMTTMTSASTALATTTSSKFSTSATTTDTMTTAFLTNIAPTSTSVSSTTASATPHTTPPTTTTPSTTIPPTTFSTITTAATATAAATITTTTTTTPSPPTTSTSSTTATTSTTTTTPTTTTPATSQEVGLWAMAVLGFSSQGDSGVNAATEALGEPDVYPTYGHNVKAWGQSNLHSLKYNQYIKLKFAMKLYITEVHVYETYRAGPTWKVEIMKPDGQYVSAYYSIHVPFLSDARIFKVTLNSVPSFTSDVIRLWVDPFFSGGAVEIDDIRQAWVGEE
ncbi:integumentary mucin C.1-like [Haliotis rubra]|uniref:integumentary mucin C.1-like n=1 Tax=Haliotis rubra TaxID=36100 RepID=UPI001EE4EF81|nr:integumentary mucin C.1-like [Haliotis rubra]